ncbi:MAG: FlgD immunoglobulin-like domain containing protein [bacterium]
MRLLASVLVSAVLCTATPLLAQIVIDWTEIPQDIGTEWSVNIKNDAAVNLGSQGGPQSWDFTSQPMGSDTVNLRVVSKGTTPFADSFPSANLVYESAEDSDTVYQYMELNPDDYGYAGLGMVVAGSTYIIRYNPMDTVPLPLNYGDSRRYYSFYTLEPQPDFVITVEKYGLQSLDAYGTITIPFGTFDCLRTCSFDTAATTTYFMGIPIISDTTTHINYSFLTENYSTLVCIASYPGETDPDYAQAAALERLQDFSTGIEESKTIVSPDNSLSHMPNPFSDCVTIRYFLATPGYVDLRVYDARGGLVKTLVRGPQGRGEHSVRWFGKNDDGKKSPDGVYFYYLKVDDTTVPGKILLIR